jgi:UDP-glucose 4-epimerase
LVAAVLGNGPPGIYNLAGDGEVTLSDLAHELSWYSVRVPRVTVDVAARLLARVPPLAVEAGWLEALRTSVLMSTTRAQELLGWRPEYDSRQTLRELVAAGSR